MRKGLTVVFILVGIVAAYFLGANSSVPLILDDMEDYEEKLVETDKQFIKSGQKININGYVIDGEEYYRLKDLEDILGFSTKTDDTNKTIELMPDREIQVNNFKPQDFKEYSLEIDYQDNRVEVEYDRKTKGIEARYLNKKTGEKIRGEEAENLIESKLLPIDYSAGEDDIINKTIESLGLDQNYKKFELDIEYMDKSEFQIEKIK